MVLPLRMYKETRQNGTIAPSQIQPPWGGGGQAILPIPTLNFQNRIGKFGKIGKNWQSFLYNLPSYLMCYLQARALGQGSRLGLQARALGQGSWLGLQASALCQGSRLGLQARALGQGSSQLVSQVATSGGANPCSRVRLMYIRPKDRCSLLCRGYLHWLKIRGIRHYDREQRCLVSLSHTLNRSV